MVLKKKKPSAREAEPQLNKPFRTPDGPKKFAVYVKNPGTGNRKKVTFGDPNMDIKRDNPERRKNFRARHGCDDPGPKTKAKYWSCKMWSTKPVSKVTQAGTSDGAVKGWDTRRSSGDSSNAAAAAAAAFGTKSWSDKSKAYRNTKRDEEDQARYNRVKSDMEKLGAKSLDEYISKAKNKGFSVSKKDMANIHRSFKKFHKEAGPKDQPGVHKKFWFYGCEAFSPSVQPPTASPQAPAPVEPVKHEPSIDEEVARLIIDNPGITGATMVNLLKAKGFKIVDDKQIEADGLSTALAVTRDGAKESSPIKDGFLNARFLESARDNGVGPVRFKVALIQEGLGNLRDAFYYTREAIESGVLAFEGKKCYADHPSRSEESDRPERSVRDIIGHFENVHVEEGDQGQSMLCADLVMLPDPPFEWARSLVRHAIGYSSTHPDKEFVGLSINAAGDAESVQADRFVKEAKIPDGALPKLKQAMQDGLTQVRVVSAIRDAVSTDLVTEPGARGKVLEILEGEQPMSKKKIALFAEDEKKLPAKQEEAKQEEAKQSEQEGEEKKEEEVKQDGEEAPEDHADEEQDKKLILDMIKKHMGEAGEGMEAEGEEAAHQAYQAYKEMGKSHEEAMKCSAEAMKLAKHMQAKQSEAEKCETDEAAHPAGPAESEKKESEGEEKAKESEIVRLTAKVAMLERELKKRELVDVLDKKLRESGLGRSETDKLRSLIGEPKSEGEIENTIKIFKEAFTLRGGESKAASIFVASVEKQAVVEKSTGKVNFGECLKKN